MKLSFPSAHPTYASFERGMAVVTATLFTALICSTLAAENEARSWKRDSDGNTLSASLVEYDEASGSVLLKLSNGKEVKVEASVLCKADQDFLTEHLEKQKAREGDLIAQREAANKPRLESLTPENLGGHMVHIYKPAGYFEADPESKKRPVAFLYSPSGKSKSIVERLKPAADELGWLLVGIDAYRNTSSLEDRYEERLKDTRAAFEWASENLSFDPRKVVFGGMSGGGWWSYQSAAELTKKTAGVLSFGGWMGNMHDQKYSKDMAVAMVNGDMDKNAISYEDIDGDFLKRRASAEVEVFHFPGGHILAPADVALKAAKWIHQTKGF